MILNKTHKYLAAAGDIRWAQGAMCRLILAVPRSGSIRIRERARSYEEPTGAGL